MFEQNENDYIHTPRSKRAASEEGETDTNASSIGDPSRLNRRQSALFRRGSQMTRSVRDAVGTIRQVSKWVDAQTITFTVRCWKGVLPCRQGLSDLNRVKYATRRVTLSFRMLVKEAKKCEISDFVNNL